MDKDDVEHILDLIHSYGIICSTEHIDDKDLDLSSASVLEDIEQLLLSYIKE